MESEGSHFLIRMPSRDASSRSLTQPLLTRAEPPLTEKGQLSKAQEIVPTNMEDIPEERLVDAAEHAPQSFEDALVKPSPTCRRLIATA